MNTIAFEDCIPGVVSTIALIIVNLIDPETFFEFNYSLSAEDFMYDGSGVAWKARFCAFLGVTMALGSIGGLNTLY
jgi:hypothetical protein